MMAATRNNSWAVKRKDERMKYLYSIRLLLLLTCIISLSHTAIYGQGFKYAEKSDFAGASDKGEIAIKIADPVLKLGKAYSVEYDFHVTNGSYAVYNWQFVSLIPLPGQLAIYDSSKIYIGDLIAFTMGSQAGISDDDWTFLHGGAHVGSALEFRAGSVPNTYNLTHNPLPTGEYYIQLILYKAFVSPNPYRADREKIEFRKTFDRSELCRSNVLKVQIVD
jgi:hypothetical protein